MTRDRYAQLGYDNQKAKEKRIVESKEQEKKEWQNKMNKIAKKTIKVFNAKNLSDEELTEQIFYLEKEQYLRKLMLVLKDCRFNGQGMRDLTSEFMEKVG